MGRLATIAVLLSLCCTYTHGEPVSAEEARQKLVEKQKQRDAERSQSITISAGELQDLKTELAALRAEVARLRAQGPAGKAAAAAIKKFDKIDLGMTRQQVMTFVDQHSKEFAITGITASKQGNGVSGVQIVKRVGAEGEKLAGTVEQVEASRIAPKHEVLDIDHFTAVKVAVGERPSFGVTYTEYEWQYKKIGGIVVTLEDDVVTAITAR